jgi:hypothetical protein
MARIFLSYAREDRARVEEIYWRLRELGFRPWMDTNDLLPGQMWDSEIRKALTSADFVLLFFSQSSVAKRGYVQREFRLVLDALQEMPEGVIHTIPIRLDNCNIPEQFRGLQWADLFDEHDLEIVVQAIRAGLSQRQQPEPGPLLEPSETPRIASTPMGVAEQFFAQAGFAGIELLSDDTLLLSSEDGLLIGMATRWQEAKWDASEHIASILQSHDQKIASEIKLYLVYKGQGPSSETIQSLRQNLRYETIPLLLSMLERALSTHECERVLKELEEPYLTRIDPYDESKPIHDPTWFYGRDAFLNRLPGILAQGQHVGIFGLRKVGKTSLTNQLRQRFLTIPTVFIDCQAFSAQATVYFDEILTQLRAELHSQRIKGLPESAIFPNEDGFRQQFVALFSLWRHTGRREPFLIILDEIDKFFPRREIRNSEEILAEFIRFFRALRGLAQSQRCLVTLVVAYRPEVNRQNLLTPGLGENPMFQSFREEHLGFLSATDSGAMILEIGLWKQIKWDLDAAQRVFHHCGGHPLISRFFASHACEGGTLKTIDYARVEETAEEIRATMRRNEIGNYYKEGIWDLLREDEQQVLGWICQNGKQGALETDIPGDLDEALTNLEHFGLVTSEGGSFHITAHLFHTWLWRRMSL